MRPEKDREATGIASGAGAPALGARGGAHPDEVRAQGGGGAGAEIDKDVLGRCLRGAE